MVFIIFVRLNGVLTMNIQELRNMFPALSRTVYGKPLVYFDNAATAQRPQTVIDKWTGLAIGANANIHRAVHKLAVLLCFLILKNHGHIIIFCQVEIFPCIRPFI